MATYAQRLRAGVDYGSVGSPESLDTPRQVQLRAAKLAQWLRQCKMDADVNGVNGRANKRSRGRGCVVHTGAGISTAAGIADFRGPQGVWTLEVQRIKKEKAKTGRRKRPKDSGGEIVKIEQEQQQQQVSCSAGESDVSPSKRLKLQSEMESETLSSTLGATATSPEILDRSWVENTEQSTLSNATQVKEEGSATAACASASASASSVATDSSAASSPNPFDAARPTKTHMAILALLRAGYIRYVSSQNVDGLHLRSGIPRDKLSELHGNLFMERCEVCGEQYFRHFDVGTVGFKRTGRFCSKDDCSGALQDMLLDWEDPLPDLDYDRAQEETLKADLSLCLGTSLRVHPACDIPFLCQERSRTPGKVAIINLQTTPFNERADMIIHARADDIMEMVCKALGVEIPEYHSDADDESAHRDVADISAGRAVNN